MKKKEKNKGRSLNSDPPPQDTSALTGPTSSNPRVPGNSDSCALLRTPTLPDLTAGEENLLDGLISEDQTMRDVDKEDNGNGSKASSEADSGDKNKNVSKNSVSSGSKSYAAAASKKGDRPAWVDDLLLSFAEIMRSQQPKKRILRKKVQFQAQPSASEQVPEVKPESHSLPHTTITDAEDGTHADAAALPVDAERDKDIDYKMAILESKLAAATSTNELMQLKLSTAESNAKRCEEERDEAAAETSRLTAELAAEKTANEAATSKSFVSSLGKPTAFSGSRGSDKLGARDWLTSISDYLASSKVANTDAQRVQFAETYLQGEAKRAWHVTRNTMSEDGITYAAFQQAIIDRWDPASSEINAMNELDDLKQTGSLTAFMQKFDRICSFIPTLTDREKVHKFLRNCNPAVATLIATDPQTKKRWTVYQDLKQYAINYVASLPPAAAAAHTTARPHLKRTGALGNIRQLVDSVHPSKRFRKSEEDGFQAAPGYGSNSARRHNSQPPRPAQPGFQWHKNAKQQWFSRHNNVIKWCHAHDICICCFETYDRGTTAKFHREHCGQPPQPDKKLPPGYEYESKNGQQQSPMPHKRH